MNVAVVGAGVVGEEMVRCLSTSPAFRNIDPQLYARSERVVQIDNRRYQVRTASLDELLPNEIVFFAGGDGAAEEMAPKLSSKRVLCIDNSSVFRMDPNVPLIVPEVNPEAFTENTKLIANPNCSTIQLVVALWPLHRTFGLMRVIVSTYQSVGGTGRAAIEELEAQELAAKEQVQSPVSTVYPRQIHRNVIPENGSFDEFGYTTEETKLLNESRKIMGLPNLELTATSVRVPTVIGHGESVWAEFGEQVSPKEAIEVLQKARGLIVSNDPNWYVTPLECAGRDEVFVGRLRQDRFNPNALAFWICADNVRKGAALNAVQIAELAIAQIPAASLA